MKKYISFLAIGAVFITSAGQALAYTLTSDDNTVVDRATGIIEKMITKKGENYRARYLRALRALQLRYVGNDRLHTIIGETITNLSDTDGVEMANVFGNITNTPTTLTTTPTPTSTTSKTPVFTSLDISPITSLPLMTGKEAAFNANFTSTSGGEIKFTINWGDGTQNTQYSMNTNVDTQGTYVPRHTFANPGQYWVDGTVTSTTTGLYSKAGLRVNVQSQGIQKINISMDGSLLSWNSIDGANSYKLEVTSTSNDAYSIVSINQSSTNFSLANSNLANGSYYVYVKAYNSAGTQIGAGNLTIQYKTTPVASRYPGCDKDDITIGVQSWAACNYGSSSVNSIGSFVPWGSLGGDVISNGWIVTPTSFGPAGNSGDVGPCASGYHVPSLEEAKYAISQAGGAFQFFEKIQSLMSGYYSSEGKFFGKEDPIYWLSTKYPYGAYFTVQDDTMPGSAFGLDTNGIPVITTPMKYVNNNYFEIMQQYLGKGAKAQIRCVKNY